MTAALALFVSAAVGARAAEAPPGPPPAPTPTPAAGPPAAPPLDRVVADLPGNLPDVGRPILQYVLAPVHEDSLVEGYVVQVLAARLKQQGAMARTIADWPRTADGRPRRQMAPCFVQRLHTGPGGAFLLCEASSPEEGPPLLTVHVYDAQTGRLVTQLRRPFTLPDELAPLGTGKATPPGRADREWLEVLDAMFGAGAEDKPEADALVARAEAGYLMDNGLWSAAAARFLRNTDEVPGPCFVRGIVSSRLADRTEDAAARLDAALRLHPDSGPLYALKAWLQLRRGQPADALPLLEQARRCDLPREGLYWYALGLVAGEGNEAAVAEQHLTRAAETLPETHFVQLHMARFLRNKGQVQQATAYYARAAASPGATAQTWAELALALDAIDRAADALDALRKALGMQPDNEAVARSLARLLKREGKPRDALDALRRASRADPCNADLAAACGEVALKMWRMDEAEETFRHAIALDDGCSLAKVRLAETLERRRRYAEARTILTDLLAAEPACQSARIQLGRLLGGLGCTDAALTMLEEAAKDTHAEAEARLAMTAALLVSNRPDAREAAVRQAQLAATADKSATSYTALCNAFLTSGLLGEAHAAATTAMERDPRSQPARLAFARVLEARSNRKAAFEQVEQVLKTDPYSAEALRLAGALHYAEGDFEKCAESWRKALALNQWDADLCESLAQLLANRLERHAEAMDYFRRCIELRRLRQEATR